MYPPSQTHSDCASNFNIFAKQSVAAAWASEPFASASESNYVSLPSGQEVTPTAGPAPQQHDVLLGAKKCYDELCVKG